MPDWIDLGSDVYASLHGCPHRDGPSGALIRFGGGLPDPGYDRDDVCVGGMLCG